MQNGNALLVLGWLEATLACSPGQRLALHLMTERRRGHVDVTPLREVDRARTMHQHRYTRG